MAAPVGPKKVCNPPLNLYRFEVEFSMKHIRESSNEAVKV